MILSRDQMGNEIILKQYPLRIISLVPSQTELLFYLGLEKETVGITRFCIYPETWFRTKKRIGGTKDIHLDLIRDLQPDLVIANKEENTQEQVMAISSFCPVWTSDISNLADALEMIREVGRITNRSQKAASLAGEIASAFQIFAEKDPLITAAYLIWKDPYMAAGGDCFIHEMMLHCGFTNVFEMYNRYPLIGSNDLLQRSPKLVLLSSEPYPFKEAHQRELNQLLPDSRVLLVNGEMFSWYGSRLLQSVAYFRNLRKLIQAVLPVNGNCV